MSINTEKDLIEKIRRTLDDTIDQMDGATRSRLRQARQAALRSQSNPWFHFSRRWLIAPAAGILAVAILSIGLLVREPEPQIAEPTDWQIIITSESLEIYQEDIGFYEWLSEVLEKGRVHLSPGRPAAVADKVSVTDRQWRNRGRTASGDDRILGHI